MIEFSYHKDCIGKPVERINEETQRRELWVGNKKINLGYGWQHAELEFEDIFELLSAGGYAFAPALTCDHRIDANFVSHALALVDIDSGMTLEELQQFPFYQLYGSGYYTTASHTEESPRFRILYRLPCAITEAETMRVIYQGLLAVHGKADISCKDAVRLFYGSVNATHRERTDRSIDAEGLQCLIEARDIVMSQRVQTTRTIAVDDRDFEPKTIEQVGELLDELRKHYADLGRSIRRDVTWGVATAVSNEVAVMLMRQRWNDANKTSKYEEFVNDHKSNAITLGTIYHMIRQHNPDYGCKRVEDYMPHDTGKQLSHLYESSSLPWFADPTIPVAKIWAFHEKKTLRKRF